MIFKLEEKVEKWRKMVAIRNKIRKEFNHKFVKKDSCKGGGCGGCGSVKLDALTFGGLWFKNVLFIIII